MTNSPVLRSHPAYIWVGPRPSIIQEAERHLIHAWCLNGGCRSCTVCLGIKNHSYYLLHWMLPAKQSYTVAQIQEVLHLLSFSLNPDEHFYIVIEFAELLSLNSAQVLLKSLEEPPRGYHFILLTESLEALLPTIISRCMVFGLSARSNLEEWSPFLAFFYQENTPSGQAFEKECEHALPPEYEARKLVEYLIGRWLEKYHTSVKENRSDQTRNAYRVLKILEETLTHMPMPGSAKLFWRTLFIKIAFLK